LVAFSPLRETDPGVTMTGAQFEGDGPVARYWLANCKGFEVTGDERGVVEELIRGGPDPHETARLVVRTKSRRRMVIPAEEITLVVPAEKVLVVERRRQRRQQRTPRVVPAARAQTRRVVAAAVPAAQAAGGAVAAAAPPAKRAVVDASKRTGVLARRAGVAVAAAAPPTRRAVVHSSRRAGTLAQASLHRATPAVHAGAAWATRVAQPVVAVLAASWRAFVAELRGSAHLAARSVAPRRRV
jgi:hypothetical protein